MIKGGDRIQNKECLCVNQFYVLTDYVLSTDLCIHFLLAKFGTFEELSVHEGYVLTRVMLSRVDLYTHEQIY